MFVPKPLGCTHLAIQNDVPHQIWEGITSTGNSQLPIWAIRIFHNKLRYFAANYAQCYIHYLSPKFFIQTIGIIWSTTLVFLLLVIWNKFPKHKKIIIIFFLTYPLVFLFELYRYL